MGFKLMYAEFFFAPYQREDMRKTNQQRRSEI